MNPYAPTCPACRTNNLATFYKSCQGCQARRAKVMGVLQSTPDASLPPPSIDGPPRCTCGVATARNTPAVRSGHEMGGYVIPDRNAPCIEPGGRRMGLGGGRGGGDD